MRTVAAVAVAEGAGRGAASSSAMRWRARKRHVAAGGGELAADEAADRAGAGDDDSCGARRTARSSPRPRVGGAAQSVARRSDHNRPHVTSRRAMITVHHLNNSRSQRVLWLLEELGLRVRDQALPARREDDAGAARAAARCIRWASRR